MSVSPLSAIQDSEARTLCREKIESLEYWLRRLVDQTLGKLSPGYFDHVEPTGRHVIKPHVAKRARARMASEPGRYPRPIDAVLLTELVNIICDADAYVHFRPALDKAFPNGVAEARTFLERIAEPRNNLAHANGVSVRAMEQVLCYSNDVIASLKAYYQSLGLETDYDVPLILLLRDSLGRVWTRSECTDVSVKNNLWLDLSEKSEYHLRPGDELALEVEVDPAFEAVPYKVEWSYGRSISGIQGTRLAVGIRENHIGQHFSVVCDVVTNRKWHRLPTNADDTLVVVFKVLPV